MDGQRPEGQERVEHGQNVRLDRGGRRRRHRRRPAGGGLHLGGAGPARRTEWSRTSSRRRRRRSPPESVARLGTRFACRATGPGPTTCTSTWSGRGSRRAHRRSRYAGLPCVSIRRRRDAAPPERASCQGGVMTSSGTATRSAPWVVVGLDNGGTSNNATVLDRRRRLPRRPAGRGAEPGARRAPAVAVDAARGTRRRCSRRPAPRGPRCARSGWTPRARPAPTASSPSRGLDQLRPPGVARLRRPRRAGGAARAAGRLQQRRQRGRALRAPRALRRRLDPPLLGLGHRRHRARRRRGRARPGGQGRGRHGRRAGPRPRSRWTACSAEDQPVPQCNCGFAGDAESVASLTGIEKNLLPYWLTRFPDHPLAEVPLGARRPRLVRGSGRAGRRARAEDLRAAGDGDRAAVHHRRQLHRPARLLRGRRRGRDRAGVPRVVPRPGAASDRRCARSRRRVPPSRSIPDLDMAGARGAAVAALAVARRDPVDS